MHMMCVGVCVRTQNLQKCTRLMFSNDPCAHTVHMNICQSNNGICYYKKIRDLVQFYK